MLDAYRIVNANVNWTVVVKDYQFNVLFQLNNLLNADYAPNGYSFGAFIDGVRKSYNYVYPQAGTNYLVKLSVKL